MMKKILFTLILLILISGCKPAKLDESTETGESILLRFEKWKEDVPKDETVQKILKQCEEEMNKKISECETYKGSIDIMMSVSNMGTKEEKDFQGIGPGGCKTDDPEARILLSTASIDSQSLGENSEFQVLCSLNCYAMECKKEITEGKNCQQPPVRSCNTECEHLPSYPTYEKEACIEQCIAEDKSSWDEYGQCVES